MKNRQKLLSSILAIIMLIPMLCLITLPVKASDNEPIIIIGDARGKKGDTVDVKITVQNNPGVSTVFFSITYDRDILKLVNVSNANSVFTDAMHSGTLEWYPFNMSWMMLLGPGVNCTNNGLITTLSFEIIGEMPLGYTDINLDYKEGDIINIEREKVRFDVQNGKIKLPDPDNTRRKGFITNNGNNADISIQDAIAIFRHLADKVILTNEEDAYAADIDGVGGITIQDAIYIFRYLADKLTMEELQAIH